MLMGRERAHDEPNMKRTNKIRKRSYEAAISKAWWEILMLRGMGTYCPTVNRLRKLFMEDGFNLVLKDHNKADRQEGEKMIF